jgi:hypothetical protein
MAVNEDYLLKNGSVVDSFTAPDGTTYEAVADPYATGIVKTVTNEDGTKTKTVLNATQGKKGRSKGKKIKGSKRRSYNATMVGLEFDSFKAAAEAAANTTEAIGYTDENINADTGGGPFRYDRGSTVTLTNSAGNSIGTVGGRIGSNTQELANAKQLADEIININKSAINFLDDDDEDDEDDDTEDTTDDSDGAGATGAGTTGAGTTGLTAGDYMQTVNPAVAGGDFTSVTPPTTVQQVGAGEVATIDPNVSQTVMQQVAPVTYQDVVPTGTMTPVGQVDPTTGTVSTTTQTGGMSAVPSQVSYKTQYAGTQGAVPQTLVTTQPGTGAAYPAVFQGYQTVPYGNALGQQIMITEFNGQPTTYVPPGFSKIEAQTTGAADGGLMENMTLEGKDRIFRKMGYNGPKTREGHSQFEEANPAAKAKGLAIGGYIQKFNKGGTVQRYETGGLTTDQLAQMQASAVRQTMQPMQPTTAMIQPTAGEFIPVDAGQTVPIAPFAEAATVGTVQQAAPPIAAAPVEADVTTVTPQVKLQTAALKAATGTPTKDVIAQQQFDTSIRGMEAALGDAIKVDAPDPREIKDGEIISGEADATKAATFTEAIQAAEATPSKQATVAGQLETLMADFEGGETPAWAAGSMRTAMATLSARGLGASSLAGQAVVQAAMEAALPIAQMDAATIAQFEAQNLSNRQQRQMLAAQQRATFMGMEFDQAFQARVANSARIGDIANMNFTAEQQIALENSRAANTMELSNLSNRQAMVMAEAAALSQLDMANLNNRQQAAVQQAANFLQMDMANLSNEQQTSMFKTQQNIQALFTDQAAENANEQFNASSENQVNQFFANLANQTSQFNATQQNAMDQFNVNSVNALREFNSQIQQQRDLFNAQNGLVIAQSNAAWRQSIATINTATQNQSNMDFAKVINGLTAANMDQIWQRERDLMSFAFQLENNNADRATTIAVQELANEAAASTAAASRSGSFANAIGSVVGAIITGPKV